MTTKPPARVLDHLAAFFDRNGYVRRQNPKRLAREGYRGYKKGDEVRLTAQDEHELRCLEDLLRRAGFRPGRAFVKGRQYRLPIYGRAAVRRFLQLVESRRNSETNRTSSAAGSRR
jgi:hypothetical protein